jgi:signal transduction histidine kinase
MDASSQERVFEPFFTTKHADRGTGLGLSISYAIVKNHSGEILCESREGEGTVFRVKLPVEGGYAE